MAPFPVSFRNQSRHAGLGHMVRIGSRKWTAAHISQLVMLIEAGSSAASAAIMYDRGARGGGARLDEHHQLADVSRCPLSTADAHHVAQSGMSGLVPK